MTWLPMYASRRGREEVVVAAGWKSQKSATTQLRNFYHASRTLMRGAAHAADLAQWHVHVRGREREREREAAEPARP